MGICLKAIFNHNSQRHLGYDILYYPLKKTSQFQLLHAPYSE